MNIKLITIFLIMCILQGCIPFIGGKLNEYYPKIAVVPKTVSTILSTTTTTTVTSTTTTTTPSTTTTIFMGNIALTVSLSTPEIGDIVFTPSSNISVTNGGVLKISGGLAGAADWKWYVDNVSCGTNSTLNWDSTGKNVGKHYISVTAEKNGTRYSGSISFLVVQ